MLPCRIVDLTGILQIEYKDFSEGKKAIDEFLSSKPRNAWVQVLAPAGWRYGFPKPYKPEPNEALEQTLLRDGYPQSLIDQGMAKHCRFIGTDEELKNLPEDPETEIKRLRSAIKTAKIALVRDDDVKTAAKILIEADEKDS